MSRPAAGFWVWVGLVLVGLVLVLGGGWLFGPLPE